MLRLKWTEGMPAATSDHMRRVKFFLKELWNRVVMVSEAKGQAWGARDFSELGPATVSRLCAKDEQFMLQASGTQCLKVSQGVLVV